MQEEILNIKAVCKNFAGVKALNGVDFSLNKGEIHALIGENGAGKSTLMKVLLGIHKMDSGTITYKGKKVAFNSPHDALQNGISMVHQEISLTNSMSIAENVWLGRENRFTKLGLVSTSLRQKETERLFKELGIQLDPSAIVKTLTVANMQLVELARAVSYNPSVLILDEPTSALSNSEIELLFGIVRNLAKKGTAIIFISHKLNELFSLCDRITIMRDGQYIATKNCKDITMEELITLVAGRELNQHRDDSGRKRAIGAEMLRVDSLTRSHYFEDISFSVKSGEIVGFSGLMGAGRSEIMRAIYGLDKFDAGKIYVDGKACHISGPDQAVAIGMGMVTEDRLRTGILPTLSIVYNTTIASLGEFCRFGVPNKKKEYMLFKAAAEKMSLKYASEKDVIKKLSGGNQQKVILSRWIFRQPKVLILDEPTRGIDIGAKTEIHKLIQTLADQGIAVIVVSSEMPELLNVCDRILVVRDGRIVYETPAESTTQEELAKYAFGA